VYYFISFHMCISYHLKQIILQQVYEQLLLTYYSILRMKVHLEELIIL